MTKPIKNPRKNITISITLRKTASTAVPLNLSRKWQTNLHKLPKRLLRKLRTRSRKLKKGESRKLKKLPRMKTKKMKRNQIKTIKNLKNHRIQAKIKPKKN